MIQHNLIYANESVDYYNNKVQEIKDILCGINVTWDISDVANGVKLAENLYVRYNTDKDNIEIVYLESNIHQYLPLPSYRKTIVLPIDNWSRKIFEIVYKRCKNEDFYIDSDTLFYYENKCILEKLEPYHAESE